VWQLNRRIYQRGFPTDHHRPRAAGLATITTISSDLPDPHQAEVRHLLTTTGR
jgi:hypothetical protein